MFHVWPALTTNCMIYLRLVIWNGLISSNCYSTIAMEMWRVSLNWIAIRIITWWLYNGIYVYSSSQLDSIAKFDSNLDGYLSIRCTYKSIYLWCILIFPWGCVENMEWCWIFIPTNFSWSIHMTFSPSKTTFSTSETLDGLSIKVHHGACVLNISLWNRYFWLSHL